MREQTWYDVSCRREKYIQCLKKNFWALVQVWYFHRGTYTKTSQLWQAVVSSSMDWLIILDKQHQHTFKNYTRIQLFLSLHFWNDAKHNAFSYNRLLVALKIAVFILADIQRDVLPFTFTHTRNWFSTDQQLHWGHFVICFPMFNEALIQVAGVVSFPSQLFKSKQNQ